MPRKALNSRRNREVVEIVKQAGIHKAQPAKKTPPAHKGQSIHKPHKTPEALLGQVFRVLSQLLTHNQGAKGGLVRSLKGDKGLKVRSLDGGKGLVVRHVEGEEGIVLRTLKDNKGLEVRSLYTKEESAVIARGRKAMDDLLKRAGELG